MNDPTGTARVLADELGMSLPSEQGNRLRFSAGAEAPGHIVDVIADPRAQYGLVAGGTVHHIAFRVPDGETQRLWRVQLVDHGYEVTEVLDRQYFTSIYFREPGGVWFEIATDTPGFDIDEPLLELGRSLKLPPWLEPSREAIENSVIPVQLPHENNPELSEA